MRMFLAVLCVAAGLVGGYASRGVPVSAQTTGGEWLPFASGQTVRLHVDLPTGTVRCKVVQVVNGFVGCAGDDRFRRSGRWINLRIVKEITPIDQ